MPKKQRFQAVFYSGDKAIDKGRVRDTSEEAKQDIKDKEEEYSMFNYYPWDRAEVEDFSPPTFQTKAGFSGMPKTH